MNSNKWGETFVFIAELDLYVKTKNRWTMSWSHMTYLLLRKVFRIESHKIWKLTSSLCLIGYLTKLQHRNKCLAKYLSWYSQLLMEKMCAYLHMVRQVVGRHSLCRGKSNLNKLLVSFQEVFNWSFNNFKKIQKAIQKIPSLSQLTKFTMTHW